MVRMKKLKQTISLLLIAAFLALMLQPNVYAVTDAITGEDKSVPANTEKIVDEGKILSFERHNPVYSLNAYKGSTFDELGLPEELRVVLEISEEDKAKFMEATPKAESDGDYAYYSYGYIAPKKDEVEEGALSIYTINYFDDTIGYRVYGSLGDDDYRFFACDEEGNITGKVCPIKVKWDKTQYREGLIGQEQKLTPSWADTLVYEGEEVYASIIETDIVEEDSHNEEMLEEEDVTEESEEQIQTEESSLEAPRMMAARAATEYQNATTNINYYTKTNGSLPGGGSYGTGIPGSWKDYVNTIFINKRFNNFSFANSGVADSWKWDGTTASVTASGTNTAANNPKVIPKKETVNGESRWAVYSVQQLLYVLKNGTGTVIIDIRRDLDFNGENYNWTAVSINNNLRIEGNGYTFYNLLSYSNSEQAGDIDGTTALVMRGKFINTNKRGMSLTVNNITFDSNLCVSFSTIGGGLFGYTSAYAEHRNEGKAENVIIKNSLFYNGGECRAAINGKSDYYNWGKHISPLGCLGSKYGVKIDKTGVIGCTVYGADHVIGFLTRAQNNDVAGTNTFTNCFVTDTTICGTGGHSSGFISCQMQKHSSATWCTTAEDCFTNVDMYGSMDVSGFNLIVNNSKMTNCFSTGKIEGYKNLVGFNYSDNSTTNDCYSTILVGMRSEATQLSGFTKGSGTYTNCYAAGEVGNHTTEMSTSKSSTTAGGFSINNSGTYSNCYYDKQTTAMREWVTTSRNTQKGQTLNGVKGVLTTDTEKAGNGLTSVPATGDTGFTGFSSNAWYYEEGIYPQLKSIKNATAADWGSAYQANLAKANSLVSVSTVYLDTWDKGYDWNNVGLRSKEEVSYARTPQEAKVAAGKASNADLLHLGSEYTYDTVRSIITDFSASDGATYTYSIKGGSGAKSILENWKTGKTVEDRGAFTIGSGTSKWKVNHPGMEWINIQGNLSESAWRPLRLIAFMEVEAGEDKQLAVNELYDHRADAEFTIMNSLTNDLVIGFDDDAVWSTAATQGYPGYQASPRDEDFGDVIGEDGQTVHTIDKHYIEVESAPTDFAESKNAWVYTEIWMTKQNGTALDEPLSVKVTGNGTNGEVLTATEEQWMGVLPIGMGMHQGTEFEVTYYWMLEDGRYRTDSKTIELLPGEYDLIEKVFNEDGSQNSTALKLGAVTADNITVGSSTSHKDELLDNARGTQVVAAWTNDNPDQTKVTSLSISFSLAGNSFNKPFNNLNKSPVIYNPKPGDEISIRVPYYGYTSYTETDTPGGGKYARVVTQYEPVDVDYVYKVESERLADGSIMNYLVFDKEATWHTNGWDTELSEEGISFADPSAQPFANMSIMQIEHDIEVILTVSGEYGLSLKKTDGGTDQDLEGVKFNIYEAANDNKRTLAEVKALPVADATSGGAALTSEGAGTGSDGILNFKNLKMGKWYYLVETQPLDGYVEWNGMVRLYRDTEGVIRMRMLDENGNQVGKEAVYNPDPYAAKESGTVDLDIKTWSEEMGGGSYVSTSVKNYQGVDMPESFGGGKEKYLFAGAVMTLLGLILLSVMMRRNNKRYI